MKKCMKCGNEMAENSKRKVCKECKHKKWGHIKKTGIFVAVVAATTGIFFYVSKNKNDEDSLSEGDDDSDLYEHTDLIDDSSEGKISQSVFENIIHEVAQEMSKVKSVLFMGQQLT